LAQQLLIYAKPNDQRLEWRPANWVQWTDPIDNVPVITCIATTFGEASLRRGRSAVLGSKGCTVIEPRALLVPHASAQTDDRQQIAPFDRRGLRHSRSGDRSGIGCGNGGFHLHRLNRRDRLARSNRSRQLPCTPSRAGAGRGRNDLVHRQVGPHRMTDLADLIGLVGQSVRRVAVLIRIHATVAVPNSLESRKARICDFSVVGDQDLRDHARPNRTSCPAVAAVPSVRPGTETLTDALPVRWSCVRRLRPGSARNQCPRSE